MSQRMDQLREHVQVALELLEEEPPKTALVAGVLMCALNDIGPKRPLDEQEGRAYFHQVRETAEREGGLVAVRHEPTLDAFSPEPMKMVAEIDQGALLFALTIGHDTWLVRGDEFRQAVERAVEEAHLEASNG